MSYGNGRNIRNKDAHSSARRQGTGRPHPACEFPCSVHWRAYIVWRSSTFRSITYPESALHSKIETRIVKTQRDRHRASLERGKQFSDRRAGRHLAAQRSSITQHLMIKRARSHLFPIMITNFQMPGLGPRRSNTSKVSTLQAAKYIIDSRPTMKSPSVQLSLLRTFSFGSNVTPRATDGRTVFNAD